MKKLHLCCGNVYLEGWMNVDVYIPHCTIYAEFDQSLVDDMKTTLDRYYKFPFGNVPLTSIRLVDRCIDLTVSFPTQYGPFEEIMIIQGIEHFTRKEGEMILKNCYDNLIEKGKLTLDFPDVLASAMLIAEGKHQEAMRFIYCSGKDSFSIHKYGYTFQTMRDLLKKIGFSSVGKWDKVVHDYPVIGVQAIK